MTPAQVKKQQGWTLVEIAVVVTTVTILSAIILQSVNLMTSGQATAKNRLRASSLAERLAQRVRDDVTYAARVFEEGSPVNVFVRMGLGSTMLPGSRLPVASSIGYFERDSALTVQTGNHLFLARHEGPQRLTISTMTGPEVYRVDRLRFVSWFVSTSRDGGLDLNRWTSVLVARWTDISRIEDTMRREAVTAALRNAGIEFAWDPSEMSHAGLYKAQADDTWVPLAQEDCVPADRRTLDFGILSRRNVEIVRNGTRTPLPVPFYANPMTNFPHGFEVKVDAGRTGGMMLVRLAVATKGRTAYAVAERRIAFREE